MKASVPWPGSYLINLGSPHPEMLAKSYEAFLSELQRCEALGIRLYNIHPGALPVAARYHLKLQ